MFGAEKRGGGGGGQGVSKGGWGGGGGGGALIGPGHSTGTDRGQSVSQRAGTGGQEGAGSCWTAGVPVITVGSVQRVLGFPLSTPAHLARLPDLEAGPDTVARDLSLPRPDRVPLLLALCVCARACVCVWPEPQQTGDLV
eukprot:SAG22_NODE_4159_length_1364_cov_1.264822_2_plen_140_part_00